MRKKEIEELIKIVEESKITELEIWEGRQRIRISKGHKTTSSAQIEMPVPLEGGAIEEIEMASTNSGEAHKLASNLKQIISPMVGTFYRAPAPEADPFVEIGQMVQLGQTVCIVEAMKVMNEIGSDYNGIIRKVLIDNSEPVEYGQPLFLVETK